MKENDNIKIESVSQAYWTFLGAQIITYLHWQDMWLTKQSKSVSILMWNFQNQMLEKSKKAMVRR